MYDFNDQIVPMSKEELEARTKAMRDGEIKMRREGCYWSLEEDRIISDICSGHYDNLLCAENKYSYVKSKHESIPRTLVYTKRADLDMLLDGITYSRTAMTHVIHRLYDYHKAISTYREEVGLGKDLVDFVYGIYHDAKRSKLNLSDLVDHYIQRWNVHPWDPFYKSWKNMISHQNADGELNFDLKVQHDDYFYLKHQLKWIGKEYDPSCWLFGAEKRLELITLLDLASESRPLRQGGAYHEQDDFAEQCKNLMLALPVPPKQLHRNRSRYKDGTVPGINLLNKYFIELDLPYKIETDRGIFEGVDKKKTVWIVKQKDTEKMLTEESTSLE